MTRFYIRRPSCHLYILICFNARGSAAFHACPNVDKSMRADWLLRMFGRILKKDLWASFSAACFARTDSVTLAKSLYHTMHPILHLWPGSAIHPHPWKWFMKFITEHYMMLLLLPLSFFFHSSSWCWFAALLLTAGFALPCCGCRHPASAHTEPWTLASESGLNSLFKKWTML